MAEGATTYAAARPTGARNPKRCGKSASPASPATETRPAASGSSRDDGNGEVRQESEEGRGAGSDERLLVRDSSDNAYVVVDSDLEPVAQLSIPPGERFTSPAGGYILVHEREASRTFHLVNLEDEANPRVHTWVLPWELLGEPGSAYRIELLDKLVAFLGSGGDSACHVTRYDLGGVLLSDQTHPVSAHLARPHLPRTAACWPPRPSTPWCTSVTAGSR